MQRLHVCVQSCQEQVLIRLTDSCRQSRTLVLKRIGLQINFFFNFAKWSTECAAPWLTPPLLTLILCALLGEKKKNCRNAKHDFFFQTGFDLCSVYRREKGTPQKCVNPAHLCFFPVFVQKSSRQPECEDPLGPPFTAHKHHATGFLTFWCCFIHFISNLIESQDGAFRFSSIPTGAKDKIIHSPKKKKDSYNTFTTSITATVTDGIQIQISFFFLNFNVHFNNLQ